MKRPHPSLVTLVVGVALGWGAAQLVGSPRRGALETREAAEAEAAAGSAAVTCPQPTTFSPGSSSATPATCPVGGISSSCRRAVAISPAPT
ncbi:MAG TPA: hypothetical protein PKU97_11355, partial [Kofleriaceae bacterium]|nr:hypothetical protein [Kofleriaceae bacterium]